MPRQGLGRRFAELALLVAVVWFCSARAFGADAQDEWRKTIDAAKKEGKIVAGGPPTGQFL
jgi:hypothetical protein